jgi:hypothetical protein
MKWEQGETEAASYPPVILQNILDGIKSDPLRMATSPWIPSKSTDIFTLPKGPQSY